MAPCFSISSIYIILSPSPPTTHLSPWSLQSTRQYLNDIFCFLCVPVRVTLSHAWRNRSIVFDSRLVLPLLHSLPSPLVLLLVSPFCALSRVSLFTPSLGRTPCCSHSIILLCATKIPPTQMEERRIPIDVLVEGTNYASSTNFLSILQNIIMNRKLCLCFVINWLSIDFVKFHLERISWCSLYTNFCFI